MKLYALSTVKHDGKVYTPGESFDVTEKNQAVELVNCGAASTSKPVKLENFDDEEAAK